ncbi:unnamed protein product [Haemonchus placei]|uniref:ORC3_N domain-containing protein n=1 Tax=Haemonchus placei TaxID=6290 RepID=A0A158QKJ0_HAEPC|nr:unnamed protein product [Haemonchus placei]
MVLDIGESQIFFWPPGLDQGDNGQTKSHAISPKDLAIIDKFDNVIDEVVRELFDEVLDKIVGYFNNEEGTIHHKNKAQVKVTSRKMIMAIIRCNISDVGRITDGVMNRLQGEVSSTVVLKPGDTNVFNVVDKLRSNGEKEKQLLIVEQAESLSPNILNGLFYALSSLTGNIRILLCLRMSTKRATFFSALSRRVLSSLDLKCFSLSSSEKVFDRLVSAVLLNPTFTHLKIEPSFARFLRSSFFRDDFSITFVKKSLRFALMQQLWRMQKLDTSNESSKKFTSSMDDYMNVLTFLHDCLFGSEKIAFTKSNPNEVCRSGEYFQPPQQILLRSVLRPISSLPNSSNFLIGMNTINSLAPDVVQHIEESIVSQKGQLLNIAVHALLKQGRWKTVALSEWGKTFAADCIAEHADVDEIQIEPMFFACVGQLEVMGIVRGSSDHETPSVTIAHHVLTSVV